jgi:hypothetical protein
MMTLLNSLIAMASATMLMTAITTSTHALDLSDTLGGVGNVVGNTLGGGGNAVGKTVNGLTGKSTEATVRLGSSRELSAHARSQMVNGIEAQAQVLSPKRLARLCISAGGGNGCSNGSRSQLLGIIDNRLDVLSDKRLASLCLSTGANGCGDGTSSGAGSLGSIAAIPENSSAAISSFANAAVPENANAAAPANATASARSHRLSSIAANLSNREAIVYKKRCSSVLRNPQAYENDIVQICKLIN